MKQALGHNGICHVYGHARLQPLLQTSVIRTTSVLTLRRSTCMRITNVYRFNSDSHSCDDDVGGNSCAEEEAQHQPTRKTATREVISPKARRRTTESAEQSQVSTLLVLMPLLN